MDYKLYDLKDIEKGTELKFKDIPLEEFENDIEMEYDYEIYEEDEEHQILMTKGYLYIPEINAKVHFIEYCNFDEEEKEYIADFDGWIFFDDKTNEWLYEEGYSSFSAAINNGFHKNIDDLKCDIYY